MDESISPQCPYAEVAASKHCAICNDESFGFHYGLQTCKSCKGFFKRTVQGKKQYECRDSQQQCVVEKSNRKCCPHCRFRKCLEKGMKMEEARMDLNSNQI